MLLLHLPDSLGKRTHALGLGAADVDIAGDVFVRRADLSAGALDQGYDFFRALAQQD